MIRFHCKLHKKATKAKLLAVGKEVKAPKSVTINFVHCSIYKLFYALLFYPTYLELLPLYLRITLSVYEVAIPCFSCLRYLTVNTRKNSLWTVPLIFSVQLLISHLTLRGVNLSCCPGAQGGFWRIFTLFRYSFVS
jgi:hypothetical protein